MAGPTYHKPGAVTWSIAVDGQKQLSRALRVLAEKEAPFLRQALEESGRLLASAAERHAPPSIASTVAFTGVKGTGAGIRAGILIKHPAGKAREFGRKWFYRGYKNRQMKQGIRVRHEPGQIPRPFVGIVHGNAAIGEVTGRVKEKIIIAINQEWERITGETD